VRTKTVKFYIYKPKRKTDVNRDKTNN